MRHDDTFNVFLQAHFQLLTGVTICIHPFLLQINPVLGFVEEASEEEEEHEESVPMFTEYVPLRGSSFHQDCQSTLKKCREFSCAKDPVELIVLPEQDNLRDCNARIIQAKVGSQWDRVGHIPKKKLPKFTAAIRNNEIKYVKFRNIKCQFIMTDTPTWTYFASVMVTKTRKWLPNDGIYKYNDQL